MWLLILPLVIRDFLFFVVLFPSFGGVPVGRGGLMRIAGTTFPKHSRLL